LLLLLLAFVDIHCDIFARQGEEDEDNEDDAVRRNIEMKIQKN